MKVHRVWIEAFVYSLLNRSPGGLYEAFKGSLTLDFRLQVFSRIRFPLALECPIGVTKNIILV
jgi:hypothetical protein